MCCCLLELKRSRILQDTWFVYTERRQRVDVNKARHALRTDHIWKIDEGTTDVSCVTMASNNAKERSCIVDWLIAIALVCHEARENERLEPRSTNSDTGTKPKASKKAEFFLWRLKRTLSCFMDLSAVVCRCSAGIIP